MRSADDNIFAVRNRSERADLSAKFRENSEKFWKSVLVLLKQDEEDRGSICPTTSG